MNPFLLAIAPLRFICLGAFWVVAIGFALYLIFKKKK
jgi:hypothetical protein